MLKKGQKIRKARNALGIGICFEPLEPRLLLSGSWGVGIDTPSQDSEVHTQSDFAQDTVAFIESTTTSIRAGQNQDQNASGTGSLVDVLSQARALDLTDLNAKRELVVVDAGIQNYTQIVDDILANADHDRAFEVIVLDADHDGIAQISGILADRSDLTAIHFITHGAEGQINLGNATLNGATLPQYSAAVTSWGDALTETGDILFYGCNIAADSTGQTLLKEIAQLTGADVAASNDLTGSRQLGGDWNLEYSQGTVERRVDFAADNRGRWSGVLGQITVTTTNDTIDGDTDSLSDLAADPGSDGEISLREAIKAANKNADADTIFLQAGTYTIISVGMDNDSGDYDIREDLSIVGLSPSATIIDGNNSSTVFDVHDDAAITVSFSNLKIQGGRSTVMVEENGAGLYISGGANTPEVHLSDVWFSGNNATVAVAEGYGGAIYNAGNLTIDRALIENNLGKKGGGIYNAAGGTLAMTNVTVSGNQTSVAEGGGLYNLGTAMLRNVTIAFNNSFTQGGGIFNTGTLDIGNSIVSDNAAGGSGDDLHGTLASSSHNIIFDNVGATVFDATNQIAVDPLLAPLADNGGSTLTHALLAGSPAVDAGTNVGAPATDQRGIVRPIDGDGDLTATVDIGAFEATGVNNVGTISIDNLTPVQGNELTATVTDADGASGVVNYQWYRDGTPIAGATAKTYTTIQDDVGAVLTVTAAYTDDLLNSESLTSTGTDPVNAKGALWLTTVGDVSAGGQPGTDTWDEGDLLQLNDPNLAFAPSTTDGTFSTAFDIDLFSSGKDIDGVHFVTADILLGTTNTFQLRAGDLLLTGHDINLTGNSASPDPGFFNSLNVKKEDVFVFRPGTPGDYSVGAFALLLEDPLGTEIWSLSLIEKDTVVGDVTLDAGDFLFSRAGGAEENDIWLYSTGDVGASTTSGSASVLIEGDDPGVSIDEKIYGLDLVETTITIGGRTLTAGTILVAVEHDEGVGPGDALAVSEFDIFALEIIQTTLGSGTGNGLVSPSLFFNGGHVAFDDGGKEALDGFTLTSIHNQAPVIILPSPAIDYTMGNTTKIDPLATVTDADSPNLDGGTLTVGFSSGGTTNDDLSILVEGNVSLSGFDVQVNLVTIGTYSGGTAGTDLVITWNADSTVADIETVITKIAYTNSVAADTSTRTVEFTLSDGDGGTSAPVRQSINFSGAVAPQLSMPNLPSIFTENAPAVIVDAGATVSDSDSPDLDGGVLTVSITVNGDSSDILSVVPGGNVTLSSSDILVSSTVIGTIDAVNDGTAGKDLVIAWNISSTPTAIQEVLRQIAFSNSSENPNDLTRTLSFSLTDGDKGISLPVVQQVIVQSCERCSKWNRYHSLHA